MVIKKYNFTLRNFNTNITDIILKWYGFNTIEEYEFETENPKFDFYIDTTTKHITHTQTTIYNNYDHEQYYYICAPLSYLTDETKKYFYNKYLFYNGYSSFDEYYIYFSYSLPCIFIKVLKKHYLENTNHTNLESKLEETPEIIEQHNQKIQKLQKLHMQTQENINIDPFNTSNNELFKIEPIIDFKNLYCKKSKNRLMVRAFNLEFDQNCRPDDYNKKTWNIFNTIIKYNKHQKAWVFPLLYKQKLIDEGVIFV